MSESPELPVVGIALDRVYAVELHYGMSEHQPERDGEGNLTFGWDWRITSDEHFEVIFQVRVGPSPERPEEVVVTSAGVFRRIGAIAAEHLSAFAKGGAPSVLFPFVREAVSNLTGRGPFGALNLPPIHVPQLMQSLIQHPPTGVQQLERRESVAMAFVQADAATTTPAVLE